MAVCLRRWRTDLLFDAGRHEGGEPPRHQLGPYGRVDDIEGLQVLLIPVSGAAAGGGGVSSAP